MKIQVKQLNLGFDPTLIEPLITNHEADTEPNGWDREDFDSFPIVEFCELASSGTYRRIDRLGVHTEHTVETHFGDGSTLLADRTWCVRPDTADGKLSFHYWNDGLKRIHTTSDTVQAGILEGKQVCVYDGDILIIAADIHTAIVKNTIVSISYSDGIGGYSLFADERHGKSMSGITHEYAHLTIGCAYENGIDILGLIDAQETYTSTTSGVAWDEDLQMYPHLQTTHPFIYREGVDGHWVWTTPDNRVAYSTSRDNTTDAQWNEYDGTTWKLSTSTSSTDYINMHFLLTNDSKYPVVKVIGQSAYSSRTNARAAIESELYNLQLGGLPSPELKFLYSIIVKRNTDLENLADGSVYVDFRQISAAGVGGASGSATYHNDLLGRDVADAHPISTITGLQVELDKPLSTGVIGTVPVLTNNGDGTVSITGCDVGLFNNTNWIGTISKYTVSALINIALTDLVSNYLVVNYNSGTPIYQVLTAVELINESDIIPIYTIYRSGINLSYINWDSLGQGLSNKLNARFVKTQRFGYESGFALSELNVRELQIESGVTWHGAVRNPLDLVNSLTDVMNFWYPVAGVWTNSLATQYTNNQYSDGTDLQTLGSNKYTTIDVYRTEMGVEKMSYVLNNVYNNVTDASNAPLAMIPQQVSTLGFIVGRLIIKSGGATALEVQSAFTHKFASVPITEHNSLSGLNDGDYIHLTAAEYATIGTTYKSSGWWSSLNIISTDLLAEDINRTQIYVTNGGTISKVKIRVDDLGSNPNSGAINFTVNGLDLFATDLVLVNGLNTVTVLQNTSVVENDEIKMVVVVGTGSDDVSDFDIEITVS